MEQVRILVRIIRVESDEEVIAADLRNVQSRSLFPGADIDGRDGVYRMWLVSYFDDELCRRSFGLSAREVVHSAAPACEHAALWSGGALLVVTSELVAGRKALDELIPVAGDRDRSPASPQAPGGRLRALGPPLRSGALNAPAKRR
jgi:hypothetical protein